MFLSVLGFLGVSTDHLCQHSGICINAGTSHHCQCPLGYTGSYCEEQLDECSSNPCQHGATCRDFIGGYRYECVPGYQGVNCEYEVDECQNQPCQNGGTCVDLVNHFKCSCPPGTRGLLCEENIDDCVGGLNSVQCERNINEGLSNPCSSESSLDCIQLTKDSLCVCRGAFTGESLSSAPSTLPWRGFE
ncbi:unnamed protein product [Nyctereutes procyonoides]|uniref:(raccoon dog) hypothetical protein n=1 Tax=Nyctereutes procyonoides TaxID=34880 RepID=A0A811ZWQ2_NYCPR|nr:unnamed protein product [Nyctereutes procyonoides]